jgi:hypothetical protein
MLFNRLIRAADQTFHNISNSGVFTLEEDAGHGYRSKDPVDAKFIPEEFPVPAMTRMKKLRVGFRTLG